MSANCLVVVVDVAISNLSGETSTFRQIGDPYFFAYFRTKTLSTVAAELNYVVTRRYIAHIASAMHLVRRVEDDRAFFGNFGFSFDIAFERAIKDDHQFVMHVFVGLMRCNARPKYGLMHLESKTGMLGSEEDAAALLGLTMQVCTLVRMVDVGVQTDWGFLFLGLAGQQRKKKIQLSARNSHMAL